MWQQRHESVHRELDVGNRRHDPIELDHEHARHRIDIDQQHDREHAAHEQLDRDDERADRIQRVQ